MVTEISLHYSVNAYVAYLNFKETKVSVLQGELEMFIY